MPRDRSPAVVTDTHMSMRPIYLPHREHVRGPAQWHPRALLCTVITLSPFCQEGTATKGLPVRLAGCRHQKV